MQRQIWVALKGDREARTAKVGHAIEAELASGDVQEAFRHLKGWYRAASETTARPCPQTMVRQMAERIALYARRDSPGEPLPINVDPIPIDDGTPTDGEVRQAVQELSNGRAGGASGIRAEDVKAWLQGIRREEDPETGPANADAGSHWRLFLSLVQAVWDYGDIPPQLLWVIVVLIPKGGGDYRGIGLLEPMWKVCERVIDKRLNAFDLHESLHGCRDRRGTGTAVIEAKLAQQLAHLEQVPFYGVFLDLKKAFDAMDRERCILILEGYGAGPRMIRLIKNFWSNATMVCRASGNYGMPFQAGRGVTQGGPLSAKLFNILVDAVAREWLRELRDGCDMEVEEIDHLMATFFAIFYVDDAYLASRDPEFLQRALDILVDLFARVGLETNVKKTQTMICTPGRIRTQLPAESYRRMRQGLVTAEEWNNRIIKCRQCDASIRASSLRRHLADQHEIYQCISVPEEYLGTREDTLFQAHPRYDGKLACPIPGCLGVMKDGWMMRRHFRDLHPMDMVVVPKEGFFPRCERCGMQVNPAYPRHARTKECQVGTDRRIQRESAITSALALRREFTVHGDALERVEVFKYLGRLLAQDDDDAQAIRQQLRKARGVWARVGQVLRGENTRPRVAAKFYKAIVQAVLLYGSETWNLTQSALARLEGFHLRAAYRMARKHKPKRGAHNVWIYPKTADVLKECGMQSIAEYIHNRRQTIAVYVATRPILEACRQGERQRGSMPRQWWWEQPMNLDGEDDEAIDATGSGSDADSADAPMN